MEINSKVCLIILDGWGIGQRDQSNPIFLAGTPYMDYLKENYPYTAIQASGIASGLAWQKEGSSETGHLIMGSGRIVFPASLRIDAAIRDNSFFEEKTIIKTINTAKQNNSAIHFITMLSSGEGYTNPKHLKSLLDLLMQEQFANSYFDLILDGLDGKNLQEAKDLIIDFQQKLIDRKVGKISSICGRFYALNKDHNPEYINKYFNLVTQAQGQALSLAEIPNFLDEHYKNKMNDDFVIPVSITDETTHPLQPNDLLFFFNAKSKHEATDYLVNKFIENNYQVFSLAEYANIPKENICFFEEKIDNTLSQVLSNNKKRQIRISEEIKQNHITNVFNGFHGSPFPGEYWTIVPGIKSLRFQDNPEMMAKSITERTLQALEENIYDFILINYPNADQAGHSGDMEIGKRIVKFLDEEIKKVIDLALKQNYYILITADHGNIEKMMDPFTGKPESSHDSSLVPLFLISNRWKSNISKTSGDIDTAEGQAIGLLSDIAPTILEMLGIPKPQEMTGSSILKSLNLF